MNIVPGNPNPNNPSRFIFDGQEIRVIAGEDGEPLFVASDVCRTLDIVNVGNALSRLDDDEKDDIRLADTIGRMQMTAVVTESGLYTLILRSDKPKAKEFKRWITHEVLPSLRKTGGYISANANPLEVAKQMIAAIENQQRQIAEHDERLSSLEAHVQPQVEHFTVIAYFRLVGLKPPSLNHAQVIGKQATALSRSRNYHIGETTDPRYGRVNTYHIDILKELIRK